jgi:isochorismate synthase/2-succinyl-5-enolpyruvyl-6-hydroxy-3-cyclohexene-1-carboxylate synthase/2-succinyl-6-hydroxy-2,4-cyclohexadiene-1-carboxylate synthase/O-succinylbenzoate synthase
MWNPLLLTGIPVALDESLDEGIAGPLAAARAAAAAGDPGAPSAGGCGGLDDPLDGGYGGGGAPAGRAMPSDAASGLGGVVIKPTAVGGLEAAWAAAEWAARAGAAAVVSSAFESSVGLSALTQLAAAIDARAGAAADGGGAFHGLGTLDWFETDAVSPGLGQLSEELEPASHAAAAGGAPRRKEFSVAAADHLLTSAASRVAGEAAAAATEGAPPSSVSLLDVACDDATVTERTIDVQLPASCLGAGAASVHCILAHPPLNCSSSSSGANGSSGSSSAGKPPVVLLHGFMGDASDWLPTMRALAAAGHPCLGVDLPGHGATRMAGSGGRGSSSCYSLDAAAEAVAGAAAAAFGASSRCVLVGYSMGARVALHMLAADAPPGGGTAAAASSTPGGTAVGAGGRWAAGVVVSGTPGIPDAEQRADRLARDTELAGALRRQGLGPFVDWWYAQPLWGSLRGHPRFGETAGRRAAAGDAEELAAALAGMSTGRMEPLWGRLPGVQVPLLLVAGGLDTKFVAIHRRMLAQLTAAADGAGSGHDHSQQQQQQRHTLVELPNCGHAVHIEAPLQLLGVLQPFLSGRAGSD